MLIGELAAKLGVNPKTIRYYESIGVLPESKRTASEYRIYDEGDLQRVAFIKGAQTLGITLDRRDPRLPRPGRTTMPLRT